MEGFEKEWLGTSLHWIIGQKEGESVEIRLEHEGLVPDLACYEVCSPTWDYFITERLKEYLEREAETV